MSTGRRDASSGSGAKRPSWKSSAASSRPAAGGKFWAQHRSESPLSSKRGFRLFISLTVLLFASAAVVLYLMRVRANPTVLVLPIDEYAYPWHPNGWAAEDAQNLKSVAETTDRVDVLLADERQQTSFDGWLNRYLDPAVERGFAEGGPGGGYIFPRYLAVAAYLSAHVTLDEKGEPCVLVPADNDAASSEDPWYGVEPRPLKDVLSTLAERMNRQTVNTWWFRSANRKLIVLDLGRSPHDMRLFEPPADLHAKIRDAVQGVNDANLAVIVSCGPGQRSWTLPELGGSLFGLHFAQAIAGAADTPGRGAGRITLREVVDYLAENVPRDARRYRGVEQKPECYYGAGQELDFELAFAGRADAKLPQKPSAGVMPMARELADSWKLFADWRTTMLPLDPWAVAETQARLVNCERLLTAGDSYRTQFEQELAETRAVLAESPPAWPVDVAGRSRSADNDANYEALAAETKTEVEAWLSQPLQPAEGATPPPLPKLSRTAAHAALWRRYRHAATGDTSDARATLTLAARLYDQTAVEDGGGSGASEALLPRDAALLESIFAGFQAAAAASQEPSGTPPRPTEASPEGSPEVSPDFDRMAALVPQLIQTYAMLEELARVADPRLHAEIAHNQGLYRSFWEAFDRWHLATPSEAGLVGAERILDSLNPSSGTGGQVPEALARKRRLEQGLRLADEAISDLPAVAWTLEHRAAGPAGGPSYEELVSLARDAAAVATRIDLASESEAAGSSDSAETSELQRRFEQVRTIAFNAAFQLAGRQKSIDPVTRLRMVSWLESPAFVPPDIRNAIRGNLLSYYQNPPPDDQQTEARLEVASGEGYEGLTAAVADALDGAATSENLSAPVANRRRQIELQRAASADAGTVFADPQRLSGDSGRQQLAEASARGRAASAWVVDRTAGGPSPTRGRWAADAQRSLAAYASLACIDFWDRGGDSQFDAAREPYFAQLADAYLDEAQDIPDQCGLDGRFVANALLEMPRTAVAAYVADSRHWRRESVFADLPAEPTRKENVVVHNAIHQAKAWAVIRGALAEGPRIASGGEPVELQVDLSGPPNTPRPLLAFLRGRVADAAITRLGESVVPQIEWKVDPTRVAKVRVDGPRVDRQILFVLDCSGSFESEEFNRGKDKLMSIVEELPETTDAGLLVFGHSTIWWSDWTAHSDRNKAVNQRYGLPKEGRTPENDIDLAIPIGPLEQPLKDQFRYELSLLKPAGYTPLYRSIDRARSELLQVARPDAATLVVVITDGADQVYETEVGQGASRRREVMPQDKRNPRLPPVNPARLKESLRRDGVTLYTIGYAWKGGNDRGGVEALSDKFVEADAEELDGILRDLLGLRRYSVSQSDRGRSAKVQDFGIEWTSETLDAPTQLLVEVTGTGVRKEIPARGGEYFDMRFDAENAQLLYWPHGEEVLGNPSRVLLSPPNDAVQVQTLRGERRSLTYFLRVALQRGDERSQPQPLPSLRPAAMWVELEMTAGEDAEPRTVRLSEVQWESNRRTPIFGVPVLNGDPRSLRVWFRFDDAAAGTLETSLLSGWNTGPLVGVLGEPRKTVDAAGSTTVEFSVPADQRLRWTLRPVVNAGAAPLLSRVAYGVADPQRVSYTFGGQLDDVEFEVERMPEQPGTGGWLTSDWLTAPTR